MSALAKPHRQLVLRPLAVAALALSLLAVFLVDASPAAAHGSAIDPPSRHYGCARRWDADWQNPIMASRDPMCWQAWQANPAAMWTWNGLIQDNVNNNHQARVPDGKLCGGGDATYAALDTPGPWQAQNVNNTFTWTMHDQARHGGAYIRLYVTKQGFNPLTQSLRWSDLELVRDTGPFSEAIWPTRPGDPILNGRDYSFQISAPGRTGRHIVYAVWRAGHADQNYYMCSDVRFPGGAPDPTTQPPTGPTGNDGCTATYAPFGQWPGGYQAEVTVKAGPAAITGWSVTMTFPDGQTIGQSWNASITPNGPSYTARNVSYNGNLAANASTIFGIMGSWLTTNRPPTLSCIATR